MTWLQCPCKQRHKLFWWPAGRWKNMCVTSMQIRHISLCSYLLTHPHFSSAELRTHFCREKSNLLLWRRGSCLCCRPQLFWNLFSMFVGTAVLWSNFPHNLCVLLRVEIVSTWVGDTRTNTPKLRMASTSHLFLVLAWVFNPHKNGKGSFLSILCLWSDDCFADFVLWVMAIDCEINSSALFYDNYLVSDCFVTYGPVNMKLIKV